MFHILLGVVGTESNCGTDEETQFSMRMMAGSGRLMKMTTLVRLSITLELSIVLPMLVFLANS